jgi:hypothetical protein
MRKNDQENQKKANIIERIIPLDRGSVMTHRESPSVEDGYRPVYHKKMTGAIRSCHFLCRRWFCGQPSRVALLCCFRFVL